MGLFGALFNRLKRLRVKIFIAITLIGVLPGIIISILFMLSYENRAVSSDTISLTNQAQLLSSQIITSGYMTDTSVASVNLQMNALGNIYSGRIMVINPSMTVIRDTYSMYEGRTIVWKNVIVSALGSVTSDYDENNHCLTVTVPIISTSDESSSVQGVLLMTRQTDTLDQNIRYFQSIVIIFMLLDLIIAVTLAVVLSGRYVYPIRHLSSEIAKVASGSESELDVDDFPETVELSNHFNEYASNLKRINDSRQEFVSNVSHELKTPLTSMKVLADSLNSMENVSADMYKEFMEDITAEIDRETDIINDLLALVRMDKAKAELSVSSVNINELIEMIMKRLRPIAEKNEIDLVMESFRPTVAEIDETKFSLAVSNLIENGIKYNNPGGYVHVSLNSDHQYFYLRVEDNGMGIPDDAIDSIFERFYRADKSHSREINGNGLGLAITKEAILMHHGEIKVSSTLEIGTTFDVRIPLNYIAGGGRV